MNDDIKLTPNKKPRLQAKRTPKTFKERDDRLYPLYDKAENELSLRIDVLVALFPLLIWSVYLYGFRPLVITALSAVLCLCLDVSARAILKIKCRFDLAPLITGIIIAYGMPPSAPLWLPVFSAIVATVATYIFGTKNSRIFDPIAISLALCFLIFPYIMGAIPNANQAISPFTFSPSDFKLAPKGALESVLSGFLPDAEPGMLFFGLRSGMIGEVSTFLIVLGFIYLVYRRVAKPLTPVVFLLTIAAITYLKPSLTAASDSVAISGALYNLFDSNTALCSVYMLSFPSASPKTTLGKVIAGAAGGAVTVGMRYYVRTDISALVGVLVINLLTPILDILFKPPVFGGDLKEGHSVENVNKEPTTEKEKENEQVIPS